MPPGPWGIPILGFLPWVDPNKPHATFTELSHDYGYIYSLRLGELIVVVLSHPTVIKEALSKDIFTGRAPLWLTHGFMNNNGLIAVEGEKWKEQRKFVTGCLKSLGAVKIGGKRELMQSRILEGVEETLNMFEDKRKCGPFDPQEILTHTVGNVMNTLVFGKTFQFEDETWKWLQHLAEEGVKLVGVSGIINFIPVLRFLPKYRRILKFMREGQLKTHDIYREIAEEKKDSKENIQSMYLEAMAQNKGKYFTEAQMLHALADLFGAGIDTTLATLRWLLLFVALHPRVQEKVQEEIDAVVGCRHGPILDDMQHCPYIEATILETMRIRPVVPLGIPHGTLEETELAGYRIPAGTMVMVNQWALHHDPIYWKEPHVFDPTRFLSPEGSVRRTEHFNPFQNGKRVCIGEELARMFVFLFGVGILKNYCIETVGDPAKSLEGVCGITLTPGQQKLKFTPRTSVSTRRNCFQISTNKENSASVNSEEEEGEKQKETSQ